MNCSERFSQLHHPPPSKCDDLKQKKREKQNTFHMHVAQFLFCGCRDATRTNRHRLKVIQDDREKQFCVYIKRFRETKDFP